MTSTYARPSEMKTARTDTRSRLKWITFAGIVACILLRTVGQAATGTLFPSPWFYALDANGNPVSNAKACFFVAGTSTSATTYSDVGLTTPNANPVRADTAGRVGPVYLAPGSSYKLTLQDATGTNGVCDGALIRTQDNIAATPSSAATVDVTGTAGEAITAGQCVYLSDGSGSKTVGQWYKCDSANDYSSSRPQTGLAPSAITAAAAGTIRIAGSVTGLSSLSVGSIYYAGSAGALTSTKPATGRALGYADSATSLIVTSNPPQPFYSTDFFDDFRVSLTTATCVTTSDVTAATTIFFTPCTGNRITLFDTNGNPTTYTTAEISIAVPATTSQMYDLFVVASSGTPALELLAWTNDTTRATAITRTNGRWVKSGDPTRLYVGSCRTTTVSGQTEDSITKRYVSNAYNRVRRTLLRKESTASWTYALGTVRQANGSTANQVDVVVGIAEVPVVLTLQAAGLNASIANVIASIGIDSTTTVSPNVFGGEQQLGNVATQPYPFSANLVDYPAAGRHFYAWLEASGGGTTTFYGTAFSSFASVKGLVGFTEG